MRKDWRENMVDPPKTCLWVQSIIREDLYRWETECGNTFEVDERTQDDNFEQRKPVARCNSCGGNIHMETKEYWGWSI